MKASRGAAVAAVASMALLASVAASFAQSPAQSDAVRGRTIQVPPGAVVIVLPPGAAAVPAGFDAGFPFAAMPSPVAMFQEMDRMMADMQRGFASLPWLAPDRVVPAAAAGTGMPAGMSGVVVTSFSNGHGTCTQRIVYGGNGAAPQVQTVSTGGNACAAAGLPSSVTPAAQPQAPRPALPNSGAMPRLIEAANHSGTAPMVLAKADE
ncbi:MAG: hypothetical protein JSR21_21040 [Proteobacteria bacterium]|nr:hypothetical protein [Pseudomonadota bacterium]